MNELSQEHYDIQMKSLKDAAGLLQTIDLPAMLAHCQKIRNADDMMLLMALNHARVHLPNDHEKAPEA
jgi:hypothetical protein